MNKTGFSERDICTKFITPAIVSAGWDLNLQVREEVSFTDGKVQVRGKLFKRGVRKRADYILYYKPNIPIAIIEAKDQMHSPRSGLQQALEYARILDIPSVFSSNGKGFIYHDRTSWESLLETELEMHEFPTPEMLWEKYKNYHGIKTEQEEAAASQDYYQDSSGKVPRYYQQIAINRTVEAIAKGQDRVLLVMATGTGKTLTAFQIIHRLQKSGLRKRILFLADRNALVDQAKRNDFKHFKDKMTVVKNRVIDKSYEVYLALYQGLSGADEEANAYKQFSRDFFDLVVIDECHRGSAKEDSAWHEILNYFSSATHLGLTATPKETAEVSNLEYFGEPVYTYSLKQGIEDGFLAPYRVIRVQLNIDVDGWSPEEGKLDKEGNEVERRQYNRSDYDRSLVIQERTELVAKKVTEFLKGFDRYAKTIVFCRDIDHAERMRHALINENSDLVQENDRYVMQITGDNPEGKRELDNFISVEERYPVIAATSELLTTGIDAQTCKVIVLDSEIRSMTKFKQIIGRGTRINEEYDKLYFNILDFRNATALFSDKAFDGEPIRVKPVGEDDDLTTIIEDEPDILWDPVEGDVDATDPINEPDVEEIKPQIHIPPPPPPEKKVYVNGVDVSVLVTSEVHFTRDGKQITTSLKDFSKGILLDRFPDLNSFLSEWSETDRKQILEEELMELGIPVDHLVEAVDRELDLFDIICHVAFDRPPLTRKERADQVRKKDYFAKYGEKARQVLQVLLDKYADEGVQNLESIDVLRVNPLTEIGSPIEIIKEFGGKSIYLQAVRELEQELYKIGA